MFHLDSRHRRLVRQQRNLVAQHFGVSGLDQQGRQAGEIAKQGRDVRVRQVLVDRVAEQALDRVQVVVLRVRIRQVVIWLREMAVSWG